GTRAEHQWLVKIGKRRVSRLYPGERVRPASAGLSQFPAARRLALFGAHAPGESVRKTSRGGCVRGARGIMLECPSPLRGPAAIRGYRRLPVLGVDVRHRERKLPECPPTSLRNRWGGSARPSRRRCVTRAPSAFPIAKPVCRFRPGSFPSKCFASTASVTG